MNDESPVRDTIERRNREICAAYAAADADAVAAAFVVDCWQMPPNSPPLVGREAVREFWHQAFGYGAWRFELETLELVVRGEVAMERGRYRTIFEPGPGSPPGMTAVDDRGNYLVLWKKDADGEWRVAWDAPVSELPLPAGP